jgi:hypothetical protein
VGDNGGSGSAGAVPIIRHPDVRRMLMSMKSQTEAMRAVAYVVASSMDIALRHADKGERAKHQAFVDFMIPIVKGWCTETGIEVASTGVQVHGGVGFIEETGAAQHYRDARITAIYEGTTGIQANDLVGRKIAREGGATAKAIVSMMRATQKALGDEMRSFGPAVDAFAECVDWIVATYGTDAKAVHASSVPFLKLAGIVTGGWQMARALLAVKGRTDDFATAKAATARFFAEHVLVQVPALRDEIVRGAGSVMALDEELF